MSLLKSIKQIFHTDPEPIRQEPDLVLGKSRKRAPRRNFSKVYPSSARINAVKPNPKRAGTGAYVRHELYLSKDIVTVGEVLNEGWTYRDIDYDVNVRHIKVVK